MRYHYDKPPRENYYGSVYICDHPVFNEATLFTIGKEGLLVVQQYFDEETKHVYWSSINPDLCTDIYLNRRFREFFRERGGMKDESGLYPAVSLRQLMWALRMKPLPRERWETYFDRKLI